MRVRDCLENFPLEVFKLLSSRCYIILQIGSLWQFAELFLNFYEPLGEPVVQLMELKDIQGCA